MVAIRIGSSPQCFADRHRSPQHVLRTVIALHVVDAAQRSQGLGVFDAAEDKKKFVIGVDANQDWMKPGLVLTSMLKRVDLAVFSTIEAAKASKFSGGVRRFGLHDKGVDYSMDEYNDKILTEPVRRRAEELKAEILAGRIVVPDYYKK
jgi:basic membrane protein A